MSDCILWTKSTFSNGYGQRKYKGKNRKAHRVVFFEAHGYWPNICRHTCDTPSCINIEHLLDGTVQDNSDDMQARGRGGASRLNHDMPSQRLENSAYQRERRLRQRQGTWIYRKADQ